MRWIQSYNIAVFQILLLLLFAAPAFGQYGKETVARLASPSFHGRGYYKNGDGKAAEFIRKEFTRFGLQPVKGSYFQNFTFPVNTFPGKMKMSLGGKKLFAGKDYIVSPACPSVKGEFKVIRVTIPVQQFNLREHGDVFILLDKSGLDSTGAAIMDSIARNPPEVRGVIIVDEKKLTWGVSGKVNDKVFIRVLKAAVPDKAEKIKLNIGNKFIPSHSANNVMAMISGSQYPDSFIVFTAHYDHLGRMGKKALFAGANDNASGTAMILDLARFYMTPENRPELSLLFIAFAGEEAGLIGSRYYTENPPLPLEKINFLLNLDLMGNGEDGLMVVNGEIHGEAFAKMDSINTSRQLLNTIGKRGKAKNSDHYWFSERGVPAFFLYTTGGSKAYHDIYDVPSEIKLTEFEDVKRLLIEFVSSITN